MKALCQICFAEKNEHILYFRTTRTTSIDAEMTRPTYHHPPHHTVQVIQVSMSDKYRTFQKFSSKQKCQY